MLLAGMIGGSPALAGPGKSDQAPGKMSDRVKELADSGRSDKVDVIVTYREKPDAAQKAKARGLGAKTTRGFDHLPMRVMRLPANAVAALAKSKGVEFVALDAPVEAFAQAAHATARKPQAGDADYFPVDPNPGHRGVRLRRRRSLGPRCATASELHERQSWRFKQCA